MVAFVVNLAHERGFSFLGTVDVQLEPGPEVEKRVVRVSGVATATPGAVRRAAEPDVPAVERTQALNLARLRGDVVATPPASLIIHREDADQELPLEQEVLTIGRALDNDLVVEDPAVSRHHAEIRRQYGHYYLTDLQSTNGTVVNGKRVSGSFLQDGDLIRVGSLELLFELGRTAGA
jgi:pSer/pThr/pTyr-binding forkhead associated (FHA) protein